MPKNLFKHANLSNLKIGQLTLKRHLPKKKLGNPPAHLRKFQIGDVTI